MGECVNLRCWRWMRFRRRRRNWKRRRPLHQRNGSRVCCLRCRAAWDRYRCRWCPCWPEDPNPTTSSFRRISHQKFSPVPHKNHNRNQTERIPPHYAQLNRFRINQADLVFRWSTSIESPLRQSNCYSGYSLLQATSAWINQHSGRLNEHTNEWIESG